MAYIKSYRNTIRACHCIRGNQQDKNKKGKGKPCVVIGEAIRNAVTAKAIHATNFNLLTYAH